MSSSIEVIILLPLLASAMDGRSVGDVATMLGQSGLLLAEGAARPLVATITHLQNEYDAAYRTYLERSQQKLELAAQHSEDFEAQRLESAALIELSRAGAGPDATLELLRRGAEQLAARLGPLTPPPTDLSAALAHLRATLEQPVSDVSALLERYRELAEQIAAASAASVSESEETLEEALGRLDADLKSALLATELQPSESEELQRQLALLQGMLADQREMARQGVSALRRRVDRKLAEGALQRARWTEQLARLGAALTALDSPGVDETTRSRAAVLRSRLAAVLAGTARDAQLNELARNADELYRGWLAQQERRLRQAVIEDNMKDVLQGLGYRVSVIAGPHTQALAVSIDDSVGVELVIDGEGRLHSEMVAYDESRLDNIATREEEVCALMDRVFEQLRARQLQVRETVRRPLQHPLELKVARRPQQPTPQAEISEPLRRRLDNEDQ